MVPTKPKKVTIKADKRKAIIDAAITVFAEKGYNNTVVAEVAAVANVAAGTVYLYFENKEDLLYQSMQEMMRETLFRLKKKIAKEERAVDKLFQFFVKHMEFFTKDPNLTRFLVLELRQSKEFYNRYPNFNPYAEYLEYIQSLIKQSIEEKTTLPYDPVSLSFLLVGVMDMMLTQWVINPEKINLEKLTGEVKIILNTGMGLG